MNIENYRTCPKCKKKSHIKSGNTCPFCRFDIAANNTRDIEAIEAEMIPPDISTTQNAQDTLPQADQVPYLKQEIKTSQAAVLIISGIVALGVFYAINSGGIAAVLNSEFFAGKPVATLEHFDLYRQFKTNELAAHSKYNGKRVTVTGPVLSNSITLGQPWVGIGGTLVPDIYCYLNKSSVEKASQYTKGQRIKATGTVDGLSLGIAVKITNCTVNKYGK